MRTRISMGIALLIIAALLLSAVPAMGQDAPLSILWWGGQSRHDRTIGVIEMYEEEMGKDIEYEFAGWSDYWTLANTKAAGSELPCIMQQDYAYLYEWQSRDLLMPLNEFLDNGTIDTTNIPELNIAGGIIDGSYYGINLGNNAQAIYIDLNAFEEAGMDLPSATWTWDEFEATAVALHEALGIWGYGYQVETGQLIAYFLSNGEHLYAPDGSGLGFADDQLMVDFYDRVLRLMDAGVMPTMDVWLSEYDGTDPGATAVSRGTAAMDYKWSNQIVAVWEGAGEGANIKLWPLPRLEGGMPSNYLKPSMFFSITSECDQPEEAAKFINFFINDNAANEVLFAERGTPISTVVLEHLVPLADAPMAEMFDFMARVSEDVSPTPPPDPVGTSTVNNDVLGPLVNEPILFGQITPAEGVALLRTEAARIFAEAK